MEAIAGDISYWLIAMGFTEGITFGATPLPTGTGVSVLALSTDGTTAISGGAATFDFADTPKSAGPYPATTESDVRLRSSSWGKNASCRQ